MEKLGKIKVREYSYFKLAISVFRTKVSDKGQVVIPKEIRDKLGLTPGTVLKVTIEEKKVVLEPVEEPPREVFVKAGAKVTEPIIREAKALSDKAKALLKDLGVSLE